METPEAPVVNEKQKQKNYYIYLFLVGSILMFFYHSDFHPIKTLLKLPIKNGTSLYKNTCPGLDGSNELKQWKTLWRIPPFHNILKSYKNKNSNLYRYKINIINVNSKLVVMDISERYKRNMSEGGSSFRVEVFSKNNLSDISHLYLCHVSDKFNGIYTVCCTLTPNMCNTISVYLMYQNFEAFADLKEKPPRVVKILTKVWCFPEVKGADPLYSLCDIPPPIHSSGHWIYESTKKHWTWMFDKPHNCLIKFLNKSEIQSCILKTNPFILIGSSHMRYNFDYFTKHLPGKWPELPRKHGSAQIGHVQFCRAHYATNLAEELWEISASNGNITGNSILGMQSGAWDLAYSNSRKYILKDLPLVYKALRNLSSETEWSKGNIIWFNAIAYP